MNIEQSKTTETLYCSFCGKSQHFVDKLVAGPSVYICDECIMLTLCVLADVEQITSTDDFRDLREAVLSLVKQQVPAQ